MRFADDTNGLLYAVSTSPEDADKRRWALELLIESDLVVSAQALPGFYGQVTRSTRPARLSYNDTLQSLEILLHVPVQAVTVEVLRAAAEISRCS